MEIVGLSSKITKSRSSRFTFKPKIGMGASKIGVSFQSKKEGEVREKSDERKCR